MSQKKQKKKGSSLHVGLLVMKFIIKLLVVIAKSIQKRNKSADNIIERLGKHEFVGQVLSLMAQPLFPSEIRAGELILAASACGTNNPWGILFDMPVEAPFEVGNLRAVPFIQLEDFNHVLSAEILHDRAGKLDASLGLCHLNIALKKQGEIPAELREFCLVFAGTILNDTAGNHAVPTLNFDHKQKTWWLEWRLVQYLPLFLGQIRLVRF
jgi:hypothetical protein